MTTLLAPESANGLRVATCEMPYMESVAMGIWTAAGSRHEPSEINGIAHFIEHLLFKGTPTRDAFAISREIEQLGASMTHSPSRIIPAIKSKGRLIKRSHC